MTSRARNWAIDTSVGGFGDVWMRLHALYALAGLKPEHKFVVRVAAPLQDVAAAVFGERLDIDPREHKNALVFTHLGLRHLARDLIRGRRFVNPFHRSNLPVERSRLVERVNRAAFSGLAAAGRMFLNDDRLAEAYGGWMQISDLPPARRIFWNAALEQFRDDFPKVREQLRAFAPAAEARIPAVIFPSGTGFQVMPATLGREILPNADYAFHEKDDYQQAFRAAGLRVVTFADVPGLLKIASGAGQALCTDSFPSHLLQTYSSNTVVALSHFPRNRVVHPAFDGVVLDSTAPCCPCLTRARSGSNTCPAGRPFCMTWDDPNYVDQLRKALI